MNDFFYKDGLCYDRNTCRAIYPEGERKTLPALLAWLSWNETCRREDPNHGTESMDVFIGWTKDLIHAINHDAAVTANHTLHEILLNGCVELQSALEEAVKPRSFKFPEPQDIRRFGEFVRFAAHHYNGLSTVATWEKPRKSEPARPQYLVMGSGIRLVDLLSWQRWNADDRRDSRDTHAPETFRMLYQWIDDINEAARRDMTVNILDAHRDCISYECGETKRRLGISLATPGMAYPSDRDFECFMNLVECAALKLNDCGICVGRRPTFRVEPSDYVRSGIPDVETLAGRDTITAPLEFLDEYVKACDRVVGCRNGFAGISLNCWNALKGRTEVLRKSVDGAWWSGVPVEIFRAYVYAEFFCECYLGKGHRPQCESHWLEWEKAVIDAKCFIEKAKTDYLPNGGLNTHVEANKGEAK